MSTSTYTLGHFITIYHGFECHDRNDHICGLPGMTNRTETCEVDYDVDKVELFVKKLDSVTFESSGSNDHHQPYFEILLLRKTSNLSLR